MSKKRRDSAPLRAAVREEVFERDGYVCQLAAYRDQAGSCFGPLTLHHKKKASQGGAYSVANGVALCSSHNCRLEAEADLAALGERLGLVIRRTA